MATKKTTTKKQPSKKSLSIVPDKKTGVLSVSQVKEMMVYETEIRKLVKAYISEHLVEGTDYGTITIKSKRTGKEYVSKPTLFKPGSEKFTSLFKLRPTFKKDVETWEMSGSKVGLYCYICELLNVKGDVVAEGRGACSTASKDGDDNNAIKIAQKRAQTDAVLRQGALSDFFTQDLEDKAVDGVIELDNQKVTRPDLFDLTIERVEAISLDKEKLEDALSKVDSLPLTADQKKKIQSRIEICLANKK